MHPKVVEDVYLGSSFVKKAKKKRLDVLPKLATKWKRLRRSGRYHSWRLHLHNPHMDKFRRWRLGAGLLSRFRPRHMLWTSVAKRSGDWKFNPKRLMPKHANDDNQNRKVNSFRAPRSRSHLNLHAFSSLLHRPLKRRGENTCSQQQEKRVPKGSVAVYVGEEHERYVIPILYLSHPDFEDLLKEAEREFGFRQKAGLTIPCRVRDFHQKLRVVEREMERERAPHCISVGGVAHNTQTRRTEARKSKRLQL